MKPKQPENEQNEQPQQFNPDDYKKIEVTFTDMEVQYIGSTLVRKQRIIQAIDVQFAEELQHFAVMVAKKKNIQFPDNKFKGVLYDTEKQKAFILVDKD